MTEAADQVLLVEKDGAIATLTLNRPKAMNALSFALRGALAEAVEALEADPQIQVLILTGAGERAFTAGLDLKELGQSDGIAGAAGSGGPVKDPVRALASFSGPIIGAINGVAITGGFEVALACDLLIGTPNTRFADTHGRVGIMPGWGLSQKLSRLIGINRAKELSLTGNFLDAETACAWGLLNRVVPADQLMSVCKQLATDMVSMDQGFQKAYKTLIDEGYATTFGEGLAIETERNRAANAAVSGDEIEARRRGRHGARARPVQLAAQGIKARFQVRILGFQPLKLGQLGREGLANVRLGKARRDELRTIPVEGFDLDHKEPLDPALAVGREPGGKVGGVACAFDTRPAEDFEARLVGIVHQEEGDAVVRFEVAGGHELPVPPIVRKAEGSGAEYLQKARWPAAMLHIRPSRFADAGDVESCRAWR